MSWLLVAVALGASSSGCSSRTDRGLPRYALVVRAHVAGDPPPTDRGLRVVAFAEQQVGRRYCWGGTGPSCFDCSGLAGTAWGSAGVRLPRTSAQIAATLPEVPLEDVRAGDILWWPGHVGIYVGGGWLVDALNARQGVVARAAVDPVRAFRP